MDDIRLYKYHRPALYSLIHRFLVLDNKLRQIFRLGPHCGLASFLTTLFFAIVALCSFLSLARVKSDERTFQALQEGVEKNVPRKKSIASIKPAYNCIHKHLQQTNVFQTKTGRMLRKEHLELEILNSKISCINKLLNEEERYSKGRL